MKLNTMGLANAAAATAAVLWLLCSFLVFALPGMMMSMTGHMVHIDMVGRGWMLTGFGFAIGLVAWVVSCWITGWLIGYFYNRFTADTH
ncbi:MULTISPECIES: DUF5676 family membrane protein [Kordiimonas]|jgi:hypothetical protein|uniref:DUF5676 family membrane protein n=1 Tax=Kordiimonas TaxID=288021 RepID=UPI00257C1DEC|nr:DUF5676 family membrane protein [Kordiimonas sp. UBA4487]